VRAGAIPIGEACQIAESLRELHQVPGVCVLFLQAEACPFGIALDATSQDVLVAAIPDRLRQIAAEIERGSVEFHDQKVRLP
jgi:hypothetical protein